MVLTMLKDLWLTGDQPNVLFYIFVPIVTIVSGVSCMYLFARLTKQAVQFLTLLAISLGANTIMQVVENVTKIIYHRVWAYPGILYLIVVLPLGFILLILGLIRWGKVKPWMAIIFVICDFIGSMIAGVVLTDVIGLTTPGS